MPGRLGAGRGPPAGRGAGEAATVRPGLWLCGRPSGPCRGSCAGACAAPRPTWGRAGTPPPRRARGPSATAFRGFSSQLQNERVRLPYLRRLAVRFERPGDVAPRDQAAEAAVRVRDERHVEAVVEHAPEELVEP